jgi:DNA-binding MarR family transcriptional regulator
VASEAELGSERARGWTFLSNHGHVLVAVNAQPDARLRELAALVGISERAVQLILADLERAGYVVKQRIGRRNAYLVTAGLHLRHPAERHSSVDDLLSIFG